MADNTICTKFQTCANDDGNPLIFESGFYTYLVGILSLSASERDCNSPDVQVTVFPYLAWVQKYVNIRK